MLQIKILENEQLIKSFPVDKHADFILIHKKQNYKLKKSYFIKESEYFAKEFQNKNKTKIDHSDLEFNDELYKGILSCFYGGSQTINQDNILQCIEILEFLECQILIDQLMKLLPQINKNKAAQLFDILQVQKSISPPVSQLQSTTEQISNYKSNPQSDNISLNELQFNKNFDNNLNNIQQTQQLIDSVNILKSSLINNLEESHQFFTNINQEFDQIFNVTMRQETSQQQAINQLECQINDIKTSISKIPKQENINNTLKSFRVSKPLEINGLNQQIENNLNIQNLNSWQQNIRNQLDDINDSDNPYFQKHSKRNSDTQIQPTKNLFSLNQQNQKNTHQRIISTPNPQFDNKTTKLSQIPEVMQSIISLKNITDTSSDVSSLNLPYDISVYDQNSQSNIQQSIISLDKNSFQINNFYEIQQSQSTVKEVDHITFKQIDKVFKKSNKIKQPIVKQRDENDYNKQNITLDKLELSEICQISIQQEISHKINQQNNWIQNNYVYEEDNSINLSIQEDIPHEFDIQPNRANNVYIEDSTIYTNIEEEPHKIDQPNKEKYINVQDESVNISLYLESNKQTNIVKNIKEEDNSLIQKIEQFQNELDKELFINFSKLEDSKIDVSSSHTQKYMPKAIQMNKNSPSLEFMPKAIQMNKSLDRNITNYLQSKLQDLQINDETNESSMMIMMQSDENLDEKINDQNYRMECSNLYARNRVVFDFLPSFSVSNFLNDLLDYSLVFKISLKRKYIASEDGFNQKKFVKKLNNLDRLIFFFKCQHGEVYGGYLHKPLKFNAYISKIEDEDAFIFNYTKQLKIDINIKKQAVKLNQENLISFGEDLVIKGEKNNQSKYPHSYKYQQSLKNGEKIFKSQFQLIEIEVYQIFLEQNQYSSFI